MKMQRDFASEELDYKFISSTYWLNDLRQTLADPRVLDVNLGNQLILTTNCMWWGVGGGYAVTSR